MIATGHFCWPYMDHGPHRRANSAGDEGGRQPSHVGKWKWDYVCPLSADGPGKCGG